MTSAIDVARFFISKEIEDRDMTQLKVQKLTYYAQGYHLGIFGKEIFGEPIKALRLGPVATSLRVFQKYGDRPISREEAVCDSIQDEETVRLLNAVWRTYGSFKPSMLVAMTHADQPWIEAWAKGEGTIISSDSMKQYFQARTQDIDLEAKRTPLDAVFEPGTTFC